MKPQIPNSFDELMRSRYGHFSAAEEAEARDLNALLGRYYGEAPRRKKKKKPSTPAQSLSCDDGEMLPQAASRRNDLAAQYSLGGGLDEEYVLGTLCESQPGRADLPAAGQPPAYTAPSTPTQPAPPLAAASQSMSQVAPASPQDEYNLDVRQPLSTPSAVYTSPPAARPTNPQPAISQAQVSEDDFVNDMKAILSGKKLYDQAQGSAGATSEGGQGAASRAQSTPGADPNSGQAIFDRIAQSMQYANAYDMGTVELNNRFADFDRAYEEQQKARQRPRKPAAAPARPSAPVGSAEFIQDLDAMRQPSAPQAPAPAAPPPPAQPAPSTAMSAPTFSRPFYDTGEHVLTAENEYVDQLLVGKAPGVAFSYGQIVAMGDLFANDKDMMDASVDELQKIKTLIVRSTAYYKGNKTNDALDVGDEDWQGATHERYLKLAEDNYEHFSPNELMKDATALSAEHRHGNNKEEWQFYHRRAIVEMQNESLAPENQNRSFLPVGALIINAFGDHFLTDAFSAGHLINKDVMTAYYLQNFYKGDELNDAGEGFFERVAHKAWGGDVKAKFSQLGKSGALLTFVRWLPFLGDTGSIDTESRFAKVLKGIANKAQAKMANMVVKTLHDRLNKEGIEVTNNAGDGAWILFGDGFMNKLRDGKNLSIIRKAVQQSIANINDPGLLVSNLDFQMYYDRVWKYTPILTSASQAKVIKYIGEYSSPNSTTLEDAAADLIKRKVDLLIKEILKDGALTKL